ncbi:MAG: SGNH/GDSL hydrolase family protein, partial [Planctomycetes bacterium]|nr:SGNH/GDSL hydrolase family protein [Planctomycetota bacterium]
MGQWGDGVLGDWETQSVMHTMEKKDCGMAAKVGVSLLALCSVLIALEVVCRLWADRRGQLRPAREADKARSASIWQKTPDPELLYVNRPNYVKNGVRLTESHGILRGTEVSPNKPKGVFRIAVLGDSVAAGLALRTDAREEPFPEKLEALLNTAPSKGRTFDVLNFGTDGYGTLQEARLLETHARQFRPDLILLQYCLNDPACSVTPGEWFIDRKRPVCLIWDYVTARLGVTKDSENPLDPRYSLYVPGSLPLRSSPATVRHWKALYRPGWKAWRSVEQGFQRIRVQADALGAPVVAVIFPLLASAEDADVAVLDRIHGQVQEEAARNGFRVLDLRS